MEGGERPEVSDRRGDDREPSADARAQLRDLRAALAGERAATEHWRQLAEQHHTALDAIRHRTAVRALLALERRALPVRDRLAGARARLVGELRRGDLVVRSLPSRGELARRWARLTTELANVPATPRAPRSVAIVSVDAPPDQSVRRAAATADAELVVVRTAGDAHAVGSGLRVIDAPGLAPSAAVALGASHTSGELLCIVAPTTEPLHEGWLDHLAAEIGGAVAAASPTLVHPRRALREATPHDLLVRMVGLAVDLDDGGVPVARAREAGAPVRTRQPTVVVAAGASACLLIERRAYEQAGGLASIPDLDAAIFDLCERFRRQGRSVVAVPSVLAFDHRTLSSRQELSAPIGWEGWGAVVQRHGPMLARATPAGARMPLRFAFTVAAPSRKVAQRWGDWHLAQAVGRSLRRLGHEVTVQTLDRVDDPTVRSRDVHVVIRGLARVRRSTGQRHVLWVISHPEQIDTDELDEADLVLVASERFAQELRERTSTPVEVLLQATDHNRFRPVPPAPEHTHPIVVVAKTRDVMRPIVADALRAGLRPAIYGSGWEDFVDPDLVVAEYVPNERLPVVYASAGVLLNDHWETMRSWGFVSNRIFDALACGTPVISDHLPEVVDLFDGTVPTYRDPDELRELVHADLTQPELARRRASKGTALVLAGHTFDHRARSLREVLRRHGLDVAAGVVG